MTPPLPKPPAGRGPRLGPWLFALVVVVLAVNVLGVWEIASALGDLRSQRVRGARLETTARARGLEATLGATAADLAFLARSLGHGFDPARQDESGGALLLFLRGHPSVEGLRVVDSAGRPALEAGRPRGVPGYWLPDEREAGVPRGAGRLRRALEAGDSRLEAWLDARSLLERGSREDGLADARCELRDADGVLLAATPRPLAPDADPLAEAPVLAEGWQAPAPFRLRCQPEQRPAARLEPLVTRYRTTIALNLAVMGLASGLGMLAFHQSRRRYQLEARAHEEARVRDLERKLFHAERLGTVGRLAAGIAHEINNPLEGMANYLRLAVDALDRDDLAASRRYVEQVGQGLERAAGVVRRVLRHAEPSATPYAAVDLAEVVRGAIDFVRLREEFGRIHFVVDARGGDVTVRGNAVMLGQVLLNLVLNACEAQPQGGEVRASCRRDGADVVAEVADRGPGVPEAERRRIFEPFESTKGSAGLGLFICESIVRQHGGELTVREREGGGAVFGMRLPADAREENGGDAG